MKESTNQDERCHKCGRPLSTPASFCTSCGAPQAPAADPTTPSRTSTTPLDEAPTAPLQPPSEPPPASAQQSPPAPPPPGYPFAPGYQAPLAHQPPGYQPPPAYPNMQQFGGVPPPPGYPGAPPAPAPDPRYLAPQPPPAAPQPKSSSALIAATALGVLALVGIAIGIYLAVSGGSNTPTRLLGAPVLAGSSAPAGTGSSPSTTPSQPAAQTHHALPSTTPTVPVPTPTPRTSTLVEARAVSNTIQRHFSLITEHQFAAAYALLAPNLQTGESSWISAHETDGIYNVDVTVNPAVHSSSAATATIVKMTTLDGHGCKHWSGDWGLVKLDGRWRISESNLSSTTC
jgi:hypothetical protein